MAEEPAAKKAKTDGSEEAETAAEPADVAMEEKKDEVQPEREAAAAEETPAAAPATSPPLPVPEPPKELEENAPESKRPKIKEAVTFYVPDTTMNVMASTTGNILKSLGDSGINLLLAGARANVAIISGRYMFEAKIIEQQRSQAGHLLKVGFSTSASDLFIGDNEESVAFESSGFFCDGSTQTSIGHRWEPYSVVAVLLNLDKDSPNYNTVSLFKNGHRVCKPQALPEKLKNKPLFPAVTFRDITVALNFGPEPMVALPFTCHIVGAADEGDCQVTKAPAAPKDGKYQVVCPIGLPDEGPFETVDMFLKKNPTFTEVSDRSLMQWCKRSGIRKGYGQVGSRDKPGPGMSLLEQGDVKRMLHSLSSMQPRNIVVMDLQSNLVKESRDVLLSNFPTSMYKRIAHIAVGEPSAEYKTVAEELTLKDKQTVADKQFRAEQAAERQRQIAAKRTKELEKAKKRSELLKKKQILEMQKKWAEAKKSTDAKAALQRAKQQALTTASAVEDGIPQEATAEEDMALAVAESEKKEGETQETKKDGEEAKEEAKKDDEEAKETEAATEGGEEKKSEEAEIEEQIKALDEEKEEPEPDVEVKDAEPPKVELTAEEKAKKYYKGDVPDMSSYALSTTFANFSLPTKAEGFEELKFEWSKEAAATKYMKDWVLSKKLITRVEDLRPSGWFQSHSSQGSKKVKEWQSVLDLYKKQIASKEAAKRAKILQKEAKLRKIEMDRVAAEAAKLRAAEEAERKKVEAEKAAAAEAEKAAAAAEKKEGEGEEKKDDAAAAAEKKEGEGEGEQKEEQKAEEEKKAEEAPKPEAEAEKKEDEMDVEKKEEEPEEVEVHVDFDGIDIFGVEDVTDIGGGMPLFKDFDGEDWVLTTLRLELSLLAHAFRKDVNDEERKGIHIDNLLYYYSRYYNKSLAPGDYGVESVEALVALVGDCVYTNKDKVIGTLLPEELETLSIFIKLAEESRRQRIISLDSGDESARLNIKYHLKGDGRGKEKATGKGDHRRGGKESRGRDHRDAGKDGAKGKGKDVGKDFGKDLGGAGKAFGKDKDKGMGKDSGKGQNPGGPMANPMQAMMENMMTHMMGKGGGGGKAPGKDFGKDGGKDFGKDFGKDKGKDVGKDKGKDVGKDKGKDFGKDKDGKSGGWGHDGGKGWGNDGGQKGWGTDAGQKGWGKDAKDGKGGKDMDFGWGKGGKDNKGGKGDWGGKDGFDKGCKGDWGKAGAKDFRKDADSGKDKGYGKDNKGGGKDAGKGWGKDAGKGWGGDYRASPYDKGGKAGKW